MRSRANVTRRETSAGGGALLEHAADLARSASIEVTVRHIAQLGRAAPLLPRGTPAYLPSLPSQTLDATLGAIAAIRALGFEPVPHVAARQLASREDLARFLRRGVSDYGVRRVMLIAGDSPDRGPFGDSLALLRDGVLGASGLLEVGLAGFPEGHPHVRSGFELLAEKVELAAEQGVGAYVVTQFSFSPDRVVRYCAELARQRPGTGLYVGIAGPTNPVALLRYAQRCGVSASRRALGHLGAGVARLAIHTNPSNQLHALARHDHAHPQHSVTGIHVYSFGGVERTARWLRDVLSEGTRGGDEIARPAS